MLVFVRLELSQGLVLGLLCVAVDGGRFAIGRRAAGG